MCHTRQNMKWKVREREEKGEGGSESMLDTQQSPEPTCTVSSGDDGMISL